MAARVRLASRSLVRHAAPVATRPPSPTSTIPPPHPPQRVGSAYTVPSSPLRRLLLPHSPFRFASPDASSSSSPPSPSARLLDGLNWWCVTVGRRCFASETSAAPEVELVEVPLAQTGEGIAECELLRWFVNEGDQVDEFQRLCEVQSDKATIEITSRFKGKVHQIHFGPGEIVKVGETLLKMMVNDSQNVSHDSIASSTDHSHAVDAVNPSDEGNAPGGTVSTPAVRHLAKQNGLNISDIQGTGKNGRVLKEDVLNYAASKGLYKELPSALEENTDQVELLEGRRSLLDAHCYEDKRTPLRGYQRAMVKSMNLAAKSLSMALSKYPLLNSCFLEEANEVIFKGSHNIGVAMATAHGLVVPNIKKSSVAFNIGDHK
ncbi:hypothetical protein GUJ93_ZPchr0001g32189 [Zizania palustris]|uniref:Dihydrolipoamide acetyltransferase component of pyruvate dehydrogenase complex n=1 Tax=Zizania palustris TaxID=103762 RepID=A0A8J5V6J9_ZIZPA|nr:hypothetical protein GUJ93_ZPchr0001g32189 [Zizania palustris]